MKTVVYVAGKSGGHIIPALTLAAQQHQQEPTTCIMFSTDAPLDAAIITPSPAINRHIPLPLDKISFKHPLFFIRFVQSCLKALYTVARSKPTHVVSTGGLVSIPVCGAAWLLRIPYDIYELNSEPGAAVRLLARGARTVFVCFKEAAEQLKGTVQLSHYPVRYTAQDRMTREAARTQLQIPQDAKVLMIVGGSQGSRFVNDQMESLVAQATAAERASLYIIHQTGRTDVARMEGVYQQAGIAAAVFAYRDDIAVWYQAADYLITRAGAGVLHELLFFNKRACIIPLETASTDHQVANAQSFVQRDSQSWCMIRQSELLQDKTLLYRTIMGTIK